MAYLGRYTLRSTGETTDRDRFIRQMLTLITDNTDMCGERIVDYSSLRGSHDEDVDHFTVSGRHDNGTCDIAHPIERSSDNTITMSGTAWDAEPLHFVECISRANPSLVFTLSVTIEHETCRSWVIKDGQSYLRDHFIYHIEVDRTEWFIREFRLITPQPNGYMGTPMSDEACRELLDKGTRVFDEWWQRYLKQPYIDPYDLYDYFARKERIGRYCCGTDGDNGPGDDDSRLLLRQMIAKQDASILRL